MEEKAKCSLSRNKSHFPTGGDLGKEEWGGGILLAPFGSPWGLVGDLPSARWGGLGCASGVLITALDCRVWREGERKKTKELVYWGRKNPTGVKEKQNS